MVDHEAEVATQRRYLLWLEHLKGPRGDNEHHAHDILEEIYMNGHCYNFAKAVQLLFPEAVLYAVGGAKSREVKHVVIRIGDQFYDIRGDVDMKERGYAWHHPLTPEEEALSQQYIYSFALRGGYERRQELP